MKGAIIQNPKDIPESEYNPHFFDWRLLRSGESYFTGFYMEYKDEHMLNKLASNITQGISGALTQGRIPFMPFSK